LSFIVCAKTVNVVAYIVDDRSYRTSVEAKYFLIFIMLYDWKN